MTDSVIIIARQIGGGGLGATTTVSCSCTKAEPNRPDCKPKTTTFPDGVSVTCRKSGGCKECTQTTTTTTSGVIMF